MLALVEGDYKFIWADIGVNGFAFDVQVFVDSELSDDGVIGFPELDPFPNDDQDLSYLIIGDDAFPLRTWMMKPVGRHNLPEHDRIFNYRISSARQIVKNAFGILGNRF